MAGAWPAAHRLISALAGMAVIAGAIVGVMTLLGVAEDYLVAGVTGFVVMSVLWLPASRRWSAQRHLCWTASLYLFVVYLAFILHWTFGPPR